MGEQKIFKFELKFQPFQGIWLFVIASKVHQKTVAPLISTKSSKVDLIDFHFNVYS